MRRKSIIEQVEEQERRREDSEKDKKFIKKLFTYLGVIFFVVIVGGGIFIYEYLQPSDAELAYKEEQKKAYLLNKKRYQACETLIKEQLNFPSTYKFKSEVAGHIVEGPYVEVSFTAKNAFGAELPQLGQCLGEVDEMVLLGIKNR
ncbi:hypothetical protein MMG00_01990 [Ignatzschineria rhizosphaerae]|uniref:DUF4845 domain-containing protein n=1 Tax=Ignatzschineria rhizosphaerae TaxID=2923279 RepID=A0ABY3X1A2_9GAMM|nr:hypothetical protein [Ignatzschineria rhizosphaerae]UNM96658.1 hypothetical protein MMG00_01990 [Ignatzschineria rhizosphaerae]